MSALEERTTEEAIVHLVHEAIYNDASFFTLATLSKNERGCVESLLANVWEEAQTRNLMQHVRALSMISCSLPWSEHPAHALFTTMIELWEPWQLEVMLQDTYSRPGLRIVALDGCG